MAYVKFHISFFLYVFKSSIQSFQFLKTKHTTYMCDGREGTAVKISHTRANTSSKTTKTVATARDHDSRVCSFFRLQRIERNETVAQRNVKFKLSLCCHY